MKANERTKLRMVDYIRHLFGSRPETFRPTSWDCVLRDGQLMVIRSFSREPTDRVIMHRFLESGRHPGLFSTYVAVRKDWQTLAKVNIEVSGSFNVNSPFLLVASNVKSHHGGRGWLTNYGRFLSRAKSFVSKRFA